jgi:hypothetical protein
MDFWTIIIIIAVVAIAAFLWPRVSARRGGPTNINPPAGTRTPADDVVPGSGTRRTEVTPHTDRPASAGIPTTEGDGDIVTEVEDDVRSQNPEKSI